MFTLPRTAIFPVAGRGTRMLPATRAMPKELLPVLDRPLLDFAVDEAVEAGIRRLVFVTHPDKAEIRRYIARRPDLPPDLDIVFVEQDEARGLGDAVLIARYAVAPGPVAVVLPDDLILGTPGALFEMVQARAFTQAAHLVATMEVPAQDVSRYGILIPDGLPQGTIRPARSLVEKPATGTAPSRLAVVGRYILAPSIFHRLAETRPGAGGEIQLTDAIAADAGRVGIAGVAFTGRRFDCGAKRGYLEATLARAAEDPELARLVPDTSAASDRAA